MQNKMKTAIKMSSSSTPIFFIVILIFALLFLSMGAASASRTLGAKTEAYTTFKPNITKEKNGFVGKQFEGCLPKGRRHSSAPSRYINDQPLGSTLCSSSNDNQVKKP
ncbi:hypothetical protein ACP275_06G194700 [Erythranthe tilingii]